MVTTIMCSARGGLAGAAELADQLREAWETDGALVIDLSEAPALDVSLIQTIESARVQAVAEGRTIALARPTSDDAASPLHASGLLWEGLAEDRQFWFHQGELA